MVGVGELVGPDGDTVSPPSGDPVTPSWVEEEEEMRAVTARTPLASPWIPLGGAAVTLASRRGVPSAGPPCVDQDVVLPAGGAVVTVLSPPLLGAAREPFSKAAIRAEESSAVPSHTATLPPLLEDAPDGVEAGA